MQKLIERFPLLAFQLAVFFSLFGINPSGGEGGEGSIFRQFGWLLLAGMCFVALVVNKQYQESMRSLLKEKKFGIFLLMVFLFFALASCRWSEVPFITFKRVFLLSVVMLIALMVVSAAQVRSINLVDLLVAPLLVLLICSAAFSVLFPGLAFSDIGWQGITGQKNSMGQLATVLVLAAYFSRGGLCQIVFVRFFIITISLVALVMSRSGTATLGLFAGFASVVVVYIFHRLKSEPSWFVPFVSLFVIVSVLVCGAYLVDWLPDFGRAKSFALGVLGKSETFTGRTALWELVINQSRYRSEIIGGGYGGFWDISPERLMYIASRLGFLPIQAHNGYLDIFNDLGYVGLGVTVSIVLYYFFSLLRHVVFSSGYSSFHIAICVYIVGVNFSESSLFRTTQFLNIIFLASFVLVAGHASSKLIAKRTNAQGI